MHPLTHCELHLWVLGPSPSDGATLQGSGVRLVNVASIALLQFAFVFHCHRQPKTFSDRCLGSNIEEGRSKV